VIEEYNWRNSAN